MAHQSLCRPPGWALAPVQSLGDRPLLCGKLYLALPTEPSAAPQYSPHCESGCLCPDGLVANGEGGCIAETDCPCVHNEASYLPGQTIRVGCNTWYVWGGVALRQSAAWSGP